MPSGPKKKTLSRSERDAIRYGFGGNSHFGQHVSDIIDGVGDMRVADVLITSAQMLALAATPITIVAAPGAGKYLEFMGAVCFLDYNSAAYAADAGEDFQLRYTDGSGALVSDPIDGELLEATADTLFVLKPIALTVAVTANTPIVADNVGAGELASGDSPFKVRCFYRIHDSAELVLIS